MTAETNGSGSEALLPSLDNLSDKEYIEVSKTFGESWLAVVEGEDGAEELLPSSVNNVFLERSAMLSAIPEGSRVMELLTAYRGAESEFFAKHGLPASNPEPLSESFIAQYPVKVRELRPGVPALIMSSNFVKPLFGYDGANFYTSVLDTSKDAMPFAVLRDTEATNSESFMESVRHETSHALWHVAREHGLDGIAEPIGSIDHDILSRMKDEAIAFATAGQRQFRHTSLAIDLRNAGLDDVADRQDAIDVKYKEIVSKLDTKTVILGIMHAGTLDELEDHMDRLLRISRPLEKKPPVQHAGSLAVTSAWDETIAPGWGSV